MERIFRDLKKGILKLKVTRLDDLWVLYLVLKKGDTVKSQTFRKIKVGDEEARQKSQNIIKRSMTVSLEVEKVSFQGFSDVLRVSGTIIEAPEDIKKGSYHTLNIGVDSILEIQKPWLKFELEKVDDACSEKKSKILVCILERDQACFAFLKEYGYEYLSEIEGEVEKKREVKSQKDGSSFYQEVKKKIQEYCDREKVEHLILASPAFFKDDLFKELPQKIQKICTLSSCYSFGKNAIDEVVRRTEVQAVLRQERIAKETKFVEELLANISRQKKAVYGLKGVEKAVENKAASSVLVSTGYMDRLKQEENLSRYESLFNLLKDAEKGKAEVHIISSENQAGKELDGLGGIAAILRFEIE